MSKKYVTQSEREKDFIVILAIILFVVPVSWLLLSDSFKDNPLREFVLSAYNFSESECVETETIYRLCEGAAEFFCENLYNERGERYHISELGCSKYCRTEKRQVGEECEFRDILVNEVGLRCRESNCHIDKLSGLKVCESVCESWKDYKTEKVCTPKYENISTRCESGEDVRRARELIK